MVSNNKKRVIVAVLLVVISLFSFFVISEKMTDKELFSTTVNVLDEQEKLVEKAAAGSLVAASLIDVIPGDAGHSIADGLVELGGYFVIIFVAIYLEKLMLILCGTLVFKILIPLGCLMLIAYLFTQSDNLKKISFKIISLGLVLALFVPASVWISQVVENQLNNGITTEVQESEENEESDEVIEDDSQEKSTGIRSWFSNRYNKMKRFISNSYEKIKEEWKGGVDSARNYLNDMMKSIAIFIITTCVIPVLTFLLLYLFIRNLLGYSVNMGSVKELADKRKVMKRQMKGKLLRGSHGEEAAADLADVVEESEDEK